MRIFGLSITERSTKGKSSEERLTRLRRTAHVTRKSGPSANAGAIGMRNEELLHHTGRNPSAALIAAGARTALTRRVGHHAAPLHAVAHACGAHAHRALVHAAVGHALRRIVVVPGRVGDCRGAHERQCGARDKKLLHGISTKFDD